MQNLLVVELVVADERRHVGVEGAERLRARPFVLQRAEKIDDLPDGAGEMLRRPGLDLAGHAVQTLGQQDAQRPAGAIAGEHVEVVNVDVALAMGAADLRRVDMRQPVIGHHLARHVEDQPAERIALVGVGVHPPVGAVEVFIDRVGDVDHRLAVAAQLVALLAIDDIGPRRGEMIGRDQRLLDDVLDLLDVRRLLGEAVSDDLDRLDRKPFGLLVVELARRLAGARDRRADFVAVEGRRNAIALDDALRCIAVRRAIVRQARQSRRRHRRPIALGAETEQTRAETPNGRTPFAASAPPGGPARGRSSCRGRSPGSRVVAPVPSSQGFRPQ